MILLCDSVSCWICGYGAIHDRLKKKLGIDFGGTTSDGQFTLLPIVCLGNCERAPVLMINDRTYANLTPEAVERLIDEHRTEVA